MVRGVRGIFIVLAKSLPPVCLDAGHVGRDMLAHTHVPCAASYASAPTRTLTPSQRRAPREGNSKHRRDSDVPGSQSDNTIKKGPSKT